MELTQGNNAITLAAVVVSCVFAAVLVLLASRGGTVMSCQCDTCAEMGCDDCKINQQAAEVIELQGKVAVLDAAISKLRKMGRMMCEDADDEDANSETLRRWGRNIHAMAQAAINLTKEVRR